MKASTRGTSNKTSQKVRSSCGEYFSERYSSYTGREAFQTVVNTSGKGTSSNRAVSVIQTLANTSVRGTLSNKEWCVGPTRGEYFSERYYELTVGDTGYKLSYVFQV